MSALIPLHFTLFTCCSLVRGQKKLSGGVFVIRSWVPFLFRSGSSSFIEVITQRGERRGVESETGFGAAFLICQAFFVGLVRKRWVPLSGRRRLGFVA